MSMFLPLEPTVAMVVTNVSKTFPLPTDHTCLRVAAPAGNQIVFAKVGNSSVIATLTDCFPILPGMLEFIYTHARGPSFVALITPLDKPASVIYVTPGEAYAS